IAAEATKEQCVAFVQKAAAYVKANGKEKAMAEFSDPKGKFVEGDLYLFVYDLKGVNLAVGNGNANKMVGKNLLNLPDPDGKLFV
ncbi:cache domain-containing protein, partial [Staphylococcus aureus]